MTPLRYRFWDTENKHMLPPQEDIAITGNGKVIFDNGEAAPHERYERVSNWIPLQSTGRTDCDGKEIFEGDVVEVKIEEAYKEDKSDILIVKYDETYRMSLCEPEHNFGLPLNWGAFLSQKIIGDIYSTPELLPQSQ